jgi:Flp pilus assembly protein TadG
MTGGAGDQIELQEGDSNSRSCSAYRPGFLARLRRSQAGNVLPMMAMAIIPLAGLVGGGVDMSRMYIAKSRLQQACDAGALAGRKVQGAGAWDANADNNLTNDPPRAAALQFFDQNYPNGLYGTTGRTRAYTEAAGRVTGTASVTVPMMIMKMFGYQSQTINVVCDAEMRLPNTDIMFVLDTTGSMAWNVSGESVSRIASLRLAVNCFYEVVAKLDTTAACPGPAPSGGTSGVQIRFGFMPYATNVNVGKLLPTSYFANDWTYQSRERQPTGTSTVSTNTNWSNTGSWSSWSSWTTHQTINNITDDDDCEDLDPPDSSTYAPKPPTTLTETTSSDGVVTRTGTGVFIQTETAYRDSYNSSTDVCTIQKQSRTRERTGTWTETTTPNFTWHYKPVSYPIGTLLKNGTSWNSSFQVPIGSTPFEGANKTIVWDGCIEERETVKATSYYPIPDNAEDLDIDQVPSQGDARSLWKPALPGLVYNRATIANDTVTNHGSHSHSSPDYTCPDNEAKKLQAWTASSFQTYVDSLAPEGSTYHDIGLLWGARFMSPTGIFASENAFTPQGGAIDRHMIFMTDGETCTTVGNYVAYGLPRLDKRQSDTTPTDDITCPNPFGWTLGASSVLNDQVNARFSALCTAVKNKGITLWVVYFGTTDTATTTRMTNCASPSRFYPAASSTALINTFRQIADQISQLRLTR